MAFQIPFDQRPYFGQTNDKAASLVTYPSDRNCVLFGPARSGKDTGIITPDLARLRRSIFVFDPRGEQAAMTYRARLKFSRCISINPFGLLVDTHPHLKSQGFNCLAVDELDPGNRDFNDNASGIGDALIKLDGDQAFFATSAKELITAVCMWIRIKKGRRATLSDVRRMITAPYGTENGKPIGLLKTLLEMSESGIEQIRSKIERYLQPSNSGRDVIATVISQTGIFDSPAIADDVSKGGFDFGDMKNELITVYLILPGDRLQTHANWSRLIVGTALRAMMRTPPGPQRPLFILNEIASLGFLEILSTITSMGGGYGMTLMSVWQSLAQIQAIYGKNAETIISARGVLSSYAPQDWTTAEYLSKLCGHRTEMMANVNARPGEAQTDLHEAPQGYPLFRPEDLMRLPARTLLNFIEPVEFPFLTRAPGYWELPWCAGLDPNPYYRPPGSGPRPPHSLRPLRDAPPAVSHRKLLEDFERRRRGNP